MKLTFKKKSWFSGEVLVKEGFKRVALISKGGDELKVGGHSFEVRTEKKRHFLSKDDGTDLATATFGGVWKRKIQLEFAENSFQILQQGGFSPNYNINQEKEKEKVGEVLSRSWLNSCGELSMEVDLPGEIAGFIVAIVWSCWTTDATNAAVASSATATIG